MRVLAIILLLGVVASASFTPKNAEDATRGFFSQFGGNVDDVAGCLGLDQINELTKTVSDFKNAMSEGWTIQKIEDLVKAVIEIKDTASDLGSVCKVENVVSQAEAFGIALKKDPKMILEKLLIQDGIMIVGKIADSVNQFKLGNYLSFGQDLGSAVHDILNVQDYVILSMAANSDKMNTIPMSDFTDFSSGLLHGLEVDETKLSYCEDNAHSLIVNVNNLITDLKEISKDPTNIIKAIERAKACYDEVTSWNGYCKTTTLIGDVKALTTKAGLEKVAQTYLKNWESVDKSAISMVEAIAQKDIFHSGEHMGEIIKTLLTFTLDSEQ